MNMSFDFAKKIINEIAPLLSSDSELYMVGGCLRDNFLNKETFDTDFIVKGQNAIELAKNFADKTGRYFLVLDEKYEIARVVDSDKLHYFDFARCENDDIEIDIKRRDLTINAIAMRVFPEEKLFDIVDGQKDLSEKIIRSISEKNLIDDPLRVLRIFRFASLLDFEIEQETLNQAKKHYKLIKNVAPERILAELIKFFEGKNSAKYLSIMKEIGLLYELFEPLKAVSKIPPNSHHHLPLIEHCIETVHQIELGYNDIPEFEKERLNSYQTNGVKYISLLKIGALLHDAGKPLTWTIEENGRHRFINHDSVGAELLKPVLKEMKFSKAQIKYITTLVKNHIYPSQLARENEEAADKPIFRMFRKLEEITPDILLLAMADRLSAQGPAITKEVTQKNISALKKYMKMYAEYIKTAKPLPKLLDGNETAEILGIEKGKELGEIIKALKNAQMSGDITTKEDAINFIKKFFKR